MLQLSENYLEDPVLTVGIRNTVSIVLVKKQREVPQVSVSANIDLNFSEHKTTTILIALQKINYILHSTDRF